MPVRQANKRETSSQKGSDYSDAVIEFQKHRGYYLDSRAEDSGEAEDLVFIPKASNQTKVVAEVKYRSSGKKGLSPNDYVEGLIERFYQWEDGAYEGYEFHLFTSHSSNEQLWLDLFKRLKDDVIESFFEKIKSEAEGDYRSFLEKHDPSRFKRFLANSWIWLDYEIGDFERIINRNQETGEYGFDPYTINYEPVRESGTLKSNLLQVVELPPELYKIPTVDDLRTADFYSHDIHDILPVHYHNNEIYSLIHPDGFDDRTSDMCLTDSVETIPFGDFAVSDPSESDVNISKVLIRGIVTTIANRVDAEVNRDRRDTRIFRRHEDDGEKQKVGRYWVTKRLDTGEVRHRSVSVFVKFFDGDYFIGLYPTTEFTKDGQKLVSGDRKKYLSDKFNTGRYPQNRRKSRTIKIWLSELALEESLTRFGLPENLQNVLIQRVDDLTLDGCRPPNSGEERDQLVEDQLAGTVNEGEEK